MFERPEVEELRLDLRDVRLELAEAYNAMRRMQQHINVLMNDKMAIAEELTGLRDRVTALATRPDGYAYEHEHGIGHAAAYGSACPACWAEDIRTALKGDSDNA